MRWFYVRARARQPLITGDRVSGSGNLLLSVPWIGGESMRGALAGALLARGMREDDPWFQEAIVQERLSIGRLYPMLEDAGNVEPDRDMALAMPATVLVCKRDASHGLFSGNRRGTCPKCGGKLKTAEGAVVQGKDRPLAVKPKTYLRTGSAVDSMRESVSEGNLYSRQVLAEGSRFGGFVRLPRSLDPARLTAVDDLRVGTAKRSGFGRVSLTWEPLPHGPFSDNPLAKRLPEQPDAQGRYHVALHLQTPLVLTDPLLNPRFDLAVDDLRVHGPDLHWGIEGYARRTELLGGWATLINRPKLHRPALAAGTVIPLSIRGARKAVRAALQSIEDHGLGEGFGAGHGLVLVNPPLSFPHAKEATPS